MTMPRHAKLALLPGCTFACLPLRFACEECLRVNQAATLLGLSEELLRLCKGELKELSGRQVGHGIGAAAATASAVLLQLLLG